MPEMPRIKQSATLGITRATPNFKHKNRQTVLIWDHTALASPG